MLITSLIFIILTLLIAVVVPIIGLIVLKNKTSYSLKIIFIGIMAFFISQMMITIPLLDYFSTMAWYDQLKITFPFLISLIVGFTSGIIEETTRYITFKFIAKNNCTYDNGIAYSLSYEGIKSIVILGFYYAMYLFTAITMLQNTFENQMLKQGVALSEIESVKSLFMDNPFLFLSDGVNQLLSFIIQILLSLFVIYSIKSSNMKYLIFAVLINSLFITMRIHLTGYIAYGFLISVFIGSIYLIKWFKDNKLSNTAT
ncbi:putative membrane protein YhfC [Natranaerovirga pectinivora]|uniref:Putative membrane protein YhfC n=1 Tax=Natranaerovirga pectinivora TaxID=682400 RepID=A0A4V2V069_9FIRM|nr:YhfC family glutamic-type intramembrane protease [Natranaerovirga pectinivora]TCT14328.1 putative membrane protein YhfC [Natranaerovirga pectinivora]